MTDSKRDYRDTVFLPKTDFPMKAGLPPAIAADLAEGRRPAGMTEDQRLVYEFCMEKIGERVIR